MPECSSKLLAAARYPLLPRRGAKHRIGEHFLGRLQYWKSIGGHPAGSDGGLRLGAAFEQAAFDQQTINANAFGHGGQRGRM